MIRILVCILTLLLVLPDVNANNVRVTRNVQVDPTAIVGNIATLDFAIEWDNSWRDDFNWDAVYIFLKCKKETDTDWKHVLLMDQYHDVSTGYEYWMAKSNATVDAAQGIFIQRGKNGNGFAAAELKLKWNIAKNGLTTTDFIDGSVKYTAMCIEMVYVPKGAFHIGDMYSKNTLGKVYRPILPEWDLIKNDGSMQFYATGDPSSAHYRTYPPSNAANRVNETRAVYSNAWYATQGAGARWWVVFPQPKRVTYFAISGAAGHQAYRPSAWKLSGSNDGVNWDVLFTNNPQLDEWYIGTDSYPAQRALKIETPKLYTQYMVSIITSTYGPMANTIAMTDVELDDYAYNSFIVDRQYPITLNTTTELGSVDGTAWSGVLNQYYPTGFEGFYTMKYEVSQDQYVRFLNKLTLKQQEARTIGVGLSNLEVGDFVYGTDKKNPSYRNGIILVAKTDKQCAFSHNLTKDDNFGQDEDGQTLACNYLSPEDMLAYADWTGLRPLSEMEFEKSARGVYPEKNKVGEFAWNKNEKDGGLKLPVTEAYEQQGTRTERLKDANVNAGNVAAGPVRVGSFTKNAADRIVAGTSYWGVMELSGNLAEICYNVCPYGRQFHSIREAHGDGNLTATGISDMSASYWPVHVESFMVKGGSFKNKKELLAISDRTNFDYYKGKNINQKDSTATFRLGHSCTFVQNEPCTTYLRLENNKVSTTDGAAVDTVCSGVAYKIKGSPLLQSSTTTSSGTTDIRKEFTGKCDYVWQISENGGATWNIISGAQEQDLVYKDFRNTATDMRTAWIRRVTTTPMLYSVTPYVTLNVINNSFTVDRYRDTIRTNNQVAGVLIETTAPANYTWRWKAAGGDVAAIKDDAKNAMSDFYYADREHFGKLSKQTHVVQCNVKIMNKCVNKVDIQIYVHDRPATGVLTNEITMGGSNALKECGVIMQDARDGEVYGTVRIGDQCWMAENLRFAMKGASQSPAADPSGKKLGALYNWRAEVRDYACPSGWKLPSDAEMGVLKTFLNRDGLNQAGLKMKSGNYWAVTSANKHLRGSNSSGLGIYGAGYNASSGYLLYGYVISAEGTYWQLYTESADFLGYPSASSYWMSIRCLKR